MSKLIGKRQAGSTSDDVGHRVLSFLIENGLAPTPENYALGYFVRTEPGGLITAAVDAILLEGRRLGETDAKRILAMRAVRGNPPNTRDSHDVILREQTIRLSDLAVSAAQRTQRFGLDLTTNLADLADCTPAIAELIDVMIARTKETESQLRIASREIEELREEVEAVKGDATRDALTGLLNRRGAVERLRALDGRRPTWIALADVDHFKSINDQLGHSAGDRVLAGVARSLAESFTDHAVARWGGEEFLIILSGIDGTEVVDICERACADLARRSFRLRGADQAVGKVTVSIGVAPIAANGYAAAIEIADRNLYAAKRSGRDRVVVQHEILAAA